MTTERVGLESYNGHQVFVSRHEGGDRDLVVFCHGFRGSNIGPARSFVRAARRLASSGISSLRFDQYGSGNSQADFIESSFQDWVNTITDIVGRHLDAGYRVSLFGQSMGASACLVAGAEMHRLSAIVAWVPDPKVDEPELTNAPFDEEGGQRVSRSFWLEARAADVASRLSLVRCPAYIVQCSEDEYVDAANREAIRRRARENHVVELLHGRAHSAWSFEEFEDTTGKSVEFLIAAFRETQAS